MLHSVIETAPLPLLDPMIRRLAAEIAEQIPLTYAFGPYLLQPERQLLVRDDETVRIGGRALEILTVLVERPGELVSKQELLARVWPHVFVEEANLKSNVAILRRLLGERHGEARFIGTVVGRGYRFVAPVRVLGGPWRNLLSLSLDGRGRERPKVAEG